MGELGHGSLEKLMKAGSPLKNAFWMKKTVGFNHPQTSILFFFQSIL